MDWHLLPVLFVMSAVVDACLSPIMGLVADCDEVGLGGCAHVQASVDGVALSLCRKLCLVLCFHYFPCLWISWFVLSLKVGLVHLTGLYSWLL